VNKKRQQIVAGAACVGAIGVLVLLWLIGASPHKRQELTYRGEPISKWFFQAPAPWGASAGDPETDREAFRAMGRQAVPFLTHRLEGDPPPTGIRAVVRALLPAARQGGPQKSTWQIRAAYLLGEIGPEAKIAESNLVKAATTFSPVRYPARLALVKIRQEQPEQVIAALKSATNWMAWVDNAIVLGQFHARAEAAVPILLAALQDPNITVQGHALSALGQIGRRADQCVPAIQPFLASPDSSLRQKAIASLGGFGAEALPAMEAIRSALEDADPWVRGRARALLTDLEIEHRKNNSVERAEQVAPPNAAPPHR
jgi:hypothetical protein